MDRTGLLNLERELEHMDWSHGITRDDVRRRMPHFPETVYLALPASKRFSSAGEMLHEALNAGSRAEGDVVPKDFDQYTSTGAEDDGGPSAWGEDPIMGSHTDDETPAR